MAKQSGLHQIRGKVGEHSYYRQTGVSSGLIRSINQGLSSRVKTSDEYANTRLNDAEFGQAGRIAKVLGMLITPKYRPMVLPFSQSKMAKIILSSIKTDSAPWGQRNLSSTAAELIQSLTSALNSVSKSDFDRYGITVTAGDQNRLVIHTDDILFDNMLSSIRADGCIVSVGFASPFIGKWGVNGGEYADSYARERFSKVGLIEGGSSVPVVPDFPSPAPEGSPWLSANFLVLVVMPYRVVNETEYVLQEHCTFKAIETPTA